MAISKEKKREVVAKVADALTRSGLVVTALYTGLSVADMQALRREAKGSEVSVTVAKNRLVKIALETAGIQLSDIGLLKGQLALLMGPDEASAVQVAANFAKIHPALVITGGFKPDGSVISAEEAKVLASLPSKDELRARLAATIAAPLSSFVNVCAGNLRAVLNVLHARVSALE